LGSPAGFTRTGFLGEDMREDIGKAAGE
jgi:hypothetical protein